MKNKSLINTYTKLLNQKLNNYKVQKKNVRENDGKP